MTAIEKMVEELKELCCIGECKDRCPLTVCKITETISRYKAEERAQKPTADNELVEKLGEVLCQDCHAVNCDGNCEGFIKNKRRISEILSRHAQANLLMCKVNPENICRETDCYTKPTADNGLVEELKKLMGHYHYDDVYGKITECIFTDLRGIISRYKPTESLACCNTCGSRLVNIRGKYPKTPDRTVCPCCVVEKLEDMVAGLDNSACSESLTAKKEEGE